MHGIAFGFEAQLTAGLVIAASTTEAMIRPMIPVTNQAIEGDDMH